MKLIIISDIHSNICALDAILREEADADEIYSAGDLTDYGPFPHEVISCFKHHNIKTVIGNHDKNLIRVWEEIKRNPRQLTAEEYRWVHYNCDKMDESDIEYLKSLPDTLDFIADGFYYRVTHQYDSGYGRPQSVFDFDNFMKKETIKNCLLPARLILGHSHRQAICQFRDNRLFINPGSISYRRTDDPDKTAHYAVIRDGDITLKAIPYDKAPLQEEVIRLKSSKTMNKKELEYADFFFDLACEVNKISI